MQTFLPYPDFRATARCLDYRRLGKQRVEAYQILRTLHGLSQGWRNHPAVLMWKGYECSLAIYTFFMCEEWLRRGYQSNGKILAYIQPWLELSCVYPPWLGDDRLHESHQSNLIRKDPVFYGPLFPGVPDDLPYYWPFMDEHCAAMNTQGAVVNINP